MGILTLYGRRCRGRRRRRRRGWWQGRRWCNFCEQTRQILWKILREKWIRSKSLDVLNFETWQSVLIHSVVEYRFLHWVVHHGVEKLMRWETSSAENASSRWRRQNGDRVSEEDGCRWETWNLPALIYRTPRARGNNGITVLVPADSSPASSSLFSG